MKTSSLASSCTVSAHLSPELTLDGSCSNPSMTITVLTSWDPFTRVSCAEINAVLLDLSPEYPASIFMDREIKGFRL